MRFHSTNVPKLLSITLFLIPSTGFAQANGQFSCSEDQRTAFYDTELKFVELASPDAIKQWKTKPVFAFDGLDAVKYGFTRAEFYRWHVPVPGREGFDQGAMSNSTDRLALAVRLIISSGERWYELANPEEDSDHSLYIQQRVGNEPGENSDETPQKGSSATGADEMEAWLRLQTATSDSKLPLFRLNYQHDESGMYQSERIDHHLLLDLRTGLPRIVKVLSCTFFEPIGGACSAQDQGAEGYDTLDCHWDAASNDFRCTMTSPYGGPHAVRRAQREFYLLAGKPAKPSYSDSPDFLPDLGQFALRIRENPKTSVQGVLVAELGPTSLLQRFGDLLPGADVFVFASSGAGDMLNTHLTLVTLTPGGKPAIQAISKWGIAGEETDEGKASPDYFPLKADDTYRTHILEQRPGFRAFDAIVSIWPNRPEPRHVVYWIGLEAAEGKLVASAVRLASEDYVYGGCGQEFHDGTATSIRKKAGVAEATVGVQGQFQYEYTNPYPTEGPNCVWTSLLHWKPGAGFRARKLAEDCKASHREVKITDNGEVTSRAAPQSP
jgi:hypothetical protein